MKLEYIGEEEREYSRIGLVRTGTVRNVGDDLAEQLIKSKLWQKPKVKKSKQETPKLGLQISGLGKDIDEELEKAQREEVEE